MRREKRYGVFVEADEAYWCVLQTDHLNEAVMEYNRRLDRGNTVDLVENVVKASIHCLQTVNLV